MGNLYVHFPFCRQKCSYCTLYSKVGVSEDLRNAYVSQLAEKIPNDSYATIYFGGGSPALCDLCPIFRVLESRKTLDCEFTVELHPLDVTERLLSELKAGGVNRISMGVQSLDDAILAHMNRGYTFEEVERAFSVVHDCFDNVGIDLIVGYPGEKAAILPQHKRLAAWGLRHCSVYALQNERGLVGVVDDETTMNWLTEISNFLSALGLERYEISNFAVPGYACRHNLAVWRGEDYLGLGDGAYGRLGLRRTHGWGGSHPTEETIPIEQDLRERRIFRLRTSEGLDASGYPEWREPLQRFVADGLLTCRQDTYFLTSRGREVCDSILVELV